MTTLAIDTSTSYGSVAVLHEERLILDERFVADRSHSSSLFTILERAVAAAPAIDRIVVGLGPGSYAGIRIAIAAAVGMQIARGAELAGLPSVAALDTSARSYIVIGDARRETFYFTQVKNGLCTEGPLLLNEQAVRERLDLYTGALLTTAPLPGFPAAEVALPSAARLAELSTKGRGVIVSDDLEPIYLREPHITLPKNRAITPGNTE